MFFSGQFSHISIFLTLVGLVLVQNGLVKCIDIMMTGPDISIGGWMEDMETREWYTNSSPPLGNSPFPDSIVVPNSVKGLSLVCNASYPVEWRFHRDRWGWRSRSQYALQTTRVSDGLDVVRFSSELSFFSFETNQVTGNYTCQKVGYPGLSQSLYVFWEGASPPFLTLARSHRKPPSIPFRNDSVSFILPCTVSVPSVEPRLVKELDTSEQVINKNSSVQYDPRVGFTMTNLPNPYGRYTCHGGDTDDDDDGDGDIVTFTVIDADDGPKPEFNETIKHGAFYNINSTARELTCCSAGQKPPKLKMIHCDHPTICALAKHSLHSMESAKRKDMGCAYIDLRFLRAGVFRCVGAGIDVVREFFYPIPEEITGMPWRRGRKGKGGKGGKQVWKNSTDNNTNSSSSSNDDNTAVTPASPAPATVDDPYFSWNEADEMKMMKVTKLNGPLYVGQNRTFSCRVSHFYYAKGLVWGVTYKNESIQYLDGRQVKRELPPHFGPSMHHFEILHGKNHEVLEMTITEDLQNITCYAPIWNSTEWGKKNIMNIVVKMPTAPKLVGKQHKEYSWYLNDTKKSLECQYSGEPMPNVLWKKGNATFALNTNTTNGSSTVYFPRVTLESEDTYQCTISNEAGTITKTFRVTVIHSTSTTVSAILVLSLVGFIIVSIVAGFMYKYLKSQSNVINHLANLAFKDVTSANGGDNSSSNNTGTTATMRSAVSVNTNGVILPPLSSPSSPQQLSAASTISASANNPIGKSNGGGHTNNGFIFDFSNSQSQDSQREGDGSPQPPLSSFSSYHKF